MQPQDSLIQGKMKEEEEVKWCSKTSIKNYETNCCYKRGIIQQQLSTGLRKLKRKTNLNLRYSK